jgi:hypothetical protein
VKGEKVVRSAHWLFPRLQPGRVSEFASSDSTSAQDWDLEVDLAVSTWM